MTGRKALALSTAIVAALIAATPWLSQSIVFMLTVALAKGLVVLGLMLLIRTGLVSFGQGLYYALGAYAAALFALRTGVSDAAIMMLVGTLVAVAAAALLGVLLAGYREIFFAMLSLALSMILYGLLVKSSALGSTDGFNVRALRIAGAALPGGREGAVLCAVAIVLAGAIGGLLQRYLASHYGRLSNAIRDNELRVEYLGASVRRIVHVNYVIAAACAGLGGALTAIAVGHVDPDMAFWTTSGEFVFVAILAGTGSVVAPFLGAALFEAIRSLANQYAPNVWQMTLGFAMLAIILYLPGGLWSLFARTREPWRRA